MKEKNNKKTIITLLILIIFIIICASLAIIAIKNKNLNTGTSSASITPITPESSTQAQSKSISEVPYVQAQNEYNAIPLPKEMRAMWISYLEWRNEDISTEASMRAVAAKMMDNCTALGLNTVIVAVRPYSDALYSSAFFPWSDLITGKQGENPNYDPLTVLIEEAHSRSLRIEAWLNPYRIRVSDNIPGVLASTHPAVLHPEWTVQVGSEVWYNPALPDVQNLVSEGIREIVANYNIDGINIDDYFYPAFSTIDADEAFDAKEHAQLASGKPRADWRRNNVNTLMQNIHATVKEANPSVSFGISPQGNNENNYNTQYSDVKKWMANEGYTDYIMPQIYWGFGYRTKSGSDAPAFINKTAEWANYPRNTNIKLYAALAPYRIGMLKSDGTRDGFGDGGFGEQSEWESGHNMADMVNHLRTVNGFSGFSLFRYEFMYPNLQDPLAANEVESLMTILD